MIDCLLCKAARPPSPIDSQQLLSLVHTMWLISFPTKPCNCTLRANPRHHTRDFLLMVLMATRHVVMACWRMRSTRTTRGGAAGGHALVAFASIDIRRLISQQQRVPQRQHGTSILAVAPIPPTIKCFRRSVAVLFEVGVTRAQHECWIARAACVAGIRGIDGTP